MKRILFTTVLFLVAGTLIFAQQADNPTSAQTRQNAQQFLGQARNNLSQFESVLADLKDRNGSNRASYTFNRLRREIERLETHISSEQDSIRASLDRGTRVNTEVMGRVENFINQHRAKLEELEDFIESTN